MFPNHRGLDWELLLSLWLLFNQAPLLEKATHEELDRIGELVRQAGIPVSVSY